MEIGAMNGKKGEKGKKSYGKGKHGKSFGKYDKSNEHSQNTWFGKGEQEKTRSRRQVMRQVGAQGE